MKKILVLGGTGAMGRPLVELLATDHEVYVTSRSWRENYKNVTYLQGNALDREYMVGLLRRGPWDAIVDFMVRNSQEFKILHKAMLYATRQYVYISSARVYAEHAGLIVEESPRLLDVCQDEEYLATDEYALMKAREEDMLHNSGLSNYTIIRPSVTYNVGRLQLGAFEMDEWLYRVMQGRPLMFSEDIADRLTAMTHGRDVARGIAAIIGRETAYGKTFHITSPTSLPWRDVMEIYVRTIEEMTGRPVKVKMTQRTALHKFENQKFRLKYCRLLDRAFDNSAISKYVDVTTFTTPQQGLKECLKESLKSPKFRNIDWLLEVVHDRESGAWARRKEFYSFHMYAAYLLDRTGLSGIKRLLLKLMNKA